MGRRDWRGAAVTFGGTAVAVATSFLVFGFLIFGYIAQAQLRRHMRMAVGSTRPTWLPGTVATVLAVVAVAVAMGWVVLAQDFWA